MNDPLKFLRHFGENFWLQTFDDKKKDKSLVGDWVMMPNESLPTKLTELNNKNAGIYFCVNELRDWRHKRKADNVEAIRAFFVDLDGADRQPVLHCGLVPNIEVNSSDGRWHYYWIMDDFVAADRRLFKELQRAIATRFNGDESVSDLCRVMRLPGFYNMKKEPFMVTYEVLQPKPYSRKEVQDEFTNPIRTNIVSGNSNMLNVANWAKVEQLFGDAGKGNVAAALDDFEFDAARLRGALIAIDPDDYGVWIEVMLALKGAAASADAELSDDEAYEWFLSWSQLSNKFDERVCEQKWQDCSVHSGIGLGTVFYKAAEEGWKGERHTFWNIDEMNAYLTKSQD